MGSDESEQVLAVLKAIGTEGTCEESGTRAYRQC